MGASGLKTIIMDVGPKKVFQGCFWTENHRFIMDIGFGRTEPPKKTFQWLQMVQSPQFGPILRLFEALRGPKKVF